jgi:hypothetical protein
MSLIKSADVPKHMADRLRSRRIAARLSSGAAKQPMTPSKAPTTSVPSTVEPPTPEVLL